MTRSLLVVLPIVLGATVAGCGSSSHNSKGSTSVNVVDSTILIGRAVTADSLRSSVLGIKVGSEAKQVRARLGEPFATPSSGGQACWAYHANQDGSASSSALKGGSALDGIDFCMSPNHRVKRILIAVHG